MQETLNKIVRDFCNHCLEEEEINNTFSFESIEENGIRFINFNHHIHFGVGDTWIERCKLQAQEFSILQGHNVLWISELEGPWIRVRPVAIMSKSQNLLLD